MMTQRKFKRLALEQEFSYNGQIYRKVKTVYKNCCVPEYNAIGPNESKILVPDDNDVEIEE